MKRSAGGESAAYAEFEAQPPHFGDSDLIKIVAPGFDSSLFWQGYVIFETVAADAVLRA